MLRFGLFARHPTQRRAGGGGPALAHERDGDAIQGLQRLARRPVANHLHRPGRPGRPAARSANTRAVGAEGVEGQDASTDLQGADRKFAITRLRARICFCA